MTNRFTHKADSTIPEHWLRLFTDPCGCRVYKSNKDTFTLRACAAHRKGARV